MNAILYSKHASIRKQQRGFRGDDIEQILMVGELLDDQTVFVTRRAVEERIRLLKAQIHQLERISGKKVVVAGDLVVTAYPTNRSEEKRCLRRGRQKAA